MIQQDKFEPVSTDASTELQVAAYRKDLIDFIQGQLQPQHPRDDYREFLELSLIILGETPMRDIHFQAPGAMHRARWMSKVIYSIKMWFFCGQFKMTSSEMKGITDIAIFAVTLHLRAWITAPWTN